MKISIIIPAHNEEKYLSKTLQSIQQQTYPAFETIVIANGCTDQTKKVAQLHALQVYDLPEPNVSHARNFGATKATGDLFLFLDADTSLQKNALQKITRHFRSKHAVATTKTRPDSNKLKFRFALAFKNLYNQTRIYQGCAGTLICRKDHFHQVGGYWPPLKVKEHRKLIIKLKRLGKYTVIPTYATTSMRRFRHWGLGKATYFWLKEWVKNYFADLKKSTYESVR